MPDTNKAVFISYRRSESSYICRAIFQHLQMHEYDVFMDIESIDSGKLDSIILNQIAARPHFLVILTPGSVEHCTDPGDWLRLEIEHAMDLQRNIVPVLVDNFSFNDAEPYLTDKLSQLKSYTGLPLVNEYFEAAMDRLRTRFLKQPVHAPTTPTPSTEHTAVQRIIKGATSTPVPTREQLSAEQYYHHGREQYDKGNYHEAITDCSEAINRNDQYAYAYILRGMARSEQGDLDGAIVDYNKAIRLDPQHPGAYYVRGLAHSDQGDLDGAINDYNEVIRLNPQDATVYNNRGNARYRKGDLDGAINDYNEVIRLNPQLAIAYRNRGMTRFDQDDRDGAINDYKKYLELGGGKLQGDQAEVEEIIEDLTKQKKKLRRRS